MIRAHDDPAALTLVVDGPATMTESPAVNEAAADALGRGARSLRLDLRDCTTIDSTFSGTLLSLKRKLEDAGGSLTLVSPSARVIELLAMMGLEDFYRIEHAEQLDGPWTEVAVTRPGAERLSRMIVDAHEQLARISGPAGTTFRTVVEEMRSEEQRGTVPSAPVVPPMPVH